LKKKKPALNDFFVGLSGKSKLIIYLLSSENSTFEQIRTMTVGGLLALRDSIDKGVPDLIDVVDDIATGRDEHESAFQYTSGRAYSESRIKDILIRAHAQVGLDYKGLKYFQKTVSQN
jgi:hypothetical protein